jgi:hypothetical protein
VTGPWLVLLGVLQSGPQATPQRDFLAAARAGTARYRDRDAAIADGYRRIGPDFPSMGEHWVNTALLVAGVQDPARPPVLEYVTVDGRPTLAGVAYAALVTDGTMPAALPLPPDAWHTHEGRVDEESFILGHAGVHDHAAHAPPPGPRVAIAHAWIWVDNPAGRYATDNWALPGLRLGIAADGPISADAGRALSLAVESGRGYFVTLLRVAGRADSAESARLGDLFARAGVEVARRLSPGRVNRTLTARELDELATLWRRTWAALLDAARPAVRRRLEAVSSVLTSAAEAPSSPWRIGNSPDWPSRTGRPVV